MTVTLRMCAPTGSPGMTRDCIAVSTSVNTSSRNETLGTIGVLAKCVLGSEFRCFSNLRHFLQRGCTIFNAILHNLDIPHFVQFLLHVFTCMSWLVQ